jgi:radical SAM-linked protein
VVLPPPPIPAFEGHFVPNQTKAQRLRVWLGKQGEMALLSHLDMMRLFERAVRRASLPIAFTGGFHPSPRISPANALSLGITSTGEIVDFELTEKLDPAEFRAKLAVQLPVEVPIYAVQEVDVTSPSATQLLEKAEYVIQVGTIGAEEKDDRPTLEQWQQWVDQVLSRPVLWQEQTTKSGKVQKVNLRDRLYALQLEVEGEGQTASIPHPLSPIHSPETEVTKTFTSPCVTLRYIGSCRNDGNLLRPEQVGFMLEQVAEREFQLGRIHRDRLILASEK